MRNLPMLLVFIAIETFAQQPNWKTVITLTPVADTWATHDDKTVHGFEKILKVGVEPQGCKTGALGYDPCPNNKEVCCMAEDGYNYCAKSLEECPTTPPHWEAQRHFRTYIRFDLSNVPQGKIKVLDARLRLRLLEVVEKMGGKPKIQVTRLKSIGNNICEWDEATLNDTNFTTWSSLPQNISKSPEGIWSFDVTKAVRDWLTGDEDKIDKPIAPNCGFHIYDPDYAKLPENPFMRWAIFSSKEGDSPPELSITIAKDLDGDGFTGDEDCDETNPFVNLGVKDVCDGIDNDCSGAEDDEVCDGIDNDCDGFIDEGSQEELCGVGMVCINHQCMKSCEDECSGPYDLSCREGEDNKWHVLHCENADDDPCLEWVDVETCEEPDPYCVLGSCSKNCIDDIIPEECDMPGKQTCLKDAAGNWAVVKCGQYDSDPCLEWSDPLPCGKGGICEDAQCYPGCKDECSVGAKKCGGDGKSVLYCYNFDDDPCWEWGGKEVCPNNGKCKDGACPAPCSDKCIEGTKKCSNQEGKTGYMTCGDYDGDGCVEFGGFAQCPSGACEDGICLEKCKDECNPKGATICQEKDGNTVAVECSNFDDDECLEWGGEEICQYGCALGKCISIEPDKAPEKEADVNTIEDATPAKETEALEIMEQIQSKDIAEPIIEKPTSRGGGGCAVGYGNGLVMILMVSFFACCRRGKR